jgi:hypothetical protein
MADVLALIGDLRRAGYERTLRAGQSAWTLIVSRSRRHGLRDGQPYVAFQVWQTGMDVIGWIDGDEHLAVPTIEMTPAVDAILRRLAAKPVD